MKRIILLIMTCMPLITMAQEQKMIDKYASIEGCSTIELSKEMIRSMGGGDGIDTLLAISVERADLIDNFSTEVKECAKDMTKMMNVAHNSQRVSIYSTSDTGSGKITKMLIYTEDKHIAIMVILTGKNIELSNVSSIMNLGL